MTLTRLGEPSQTSARSSMMTTMLVSHGNSRWRLLRVRPEEVGAHSQRALAAAPPPVARLTPTLVAAQDSPAKEPAVRVDDLAHLGRVRARAHRVDVHLIQLRDVLKELLQPGPV